MINPEQIASLMLVHTPAMRGDCEAPASEVAFSKADCNCSWRTTQVQHQQNSVQFVLM